MREFFAKRFAKKMEIHPNGVQFRKFGFGRTDFLRGFRISSKSVRTCSAISAFRPDLRNAELLQRVYFVIEPHVNPVKTDGSPESDESQKSAPQETLPQMVKDSAPQTTMRFLNPRETAFVI